MKIALFFSYGVGLTTWEWLGSFDREVALYREYVKRGHEIFLFTYEKDDRFSSRLPEAIHIFSKKMRVPNTLYSFLIPFVYRKELRTCDVYKTNQLLGSWSALIAGRLWNKPVVVRTGFTPSIYYTTTKKFVKKVVSHFLETMSLLLSSAYIVSSESEKDYLKRHPRIQVIPNYVDTDLFMPSDKQKTDPFEILFVGRLEKEKNLFSLLDALQNIPCHLTMIGSGSLKQTLEEYALKQSVSVTFLGAVSHKRLPHYFQQADLFVLPSLFEGTPKVLLEAMSCGMPVLVSRLAAMTQIVTHGYNGIVADMDALSLNTALQMLMIRPDVRVHIGQNARKTILERFSLDRYVQEEEQVLIRVIGANSWMP